MVPQSFSTVSSSASVPLSPTECEVLSTEEDSVIVGISRPGAQHLQPTESSVIAPDSITYPLHTPPQQAPLNSSAPACSSGTHEHQRYHCTQYTGVDSNSSLYPHPSQQNYNPQRPSAGLRSRPFSVCSDNECVDLDSSQGITGEESHCGVGGVHCSDVESGSCSSVSSDCEALNPRQPSTLNCNTTATMPIVTNYSSSSRYKSSAIGGMSKDDYCSIESELCSTTADDSFSNASECSSSSSSCVSASGAATHGLMTPSSCFGQYTYSSLGDESPLGLPYTASAHTPSKGSGSSSDCEAASSARSLRDIQADLDTMDFNALRRYALQTTERLLQVEQESASLRRGARRHEQAYISMASRRQLSYLTRQNLYLSKVKLIQLRAESDRQERQRLEVEVRKMKKLCREAANSLRNGMASQKAVQEREASLLRQIREAEGHTETLQQLVDHFREQLERQLKSE